MLNGDLVRLRLIREADLDNYFDLMADFKSRGDYYPLGMVSESKLRQQFASTGFWSSDEGTLLIEDSSGAIVGEIEFFPITHYLQGYELSYLVFGTEHRGRGYIPEAVRLLVDYLFGCRRVNRIQLNIHPGNEPSKRVAAKCGFTLEGIMRQCWFHQGTCHDLEIWSMVRDEWSPG